jgi:preprotein translocase subunit SecF
MTSTVYPIISRHIRVFFLISALFLIPGIFSFIRFGLKPSIDFTGGSIIEVAFPTKQVKDVSPAQITETLGGEFTIINQQVSGPQTLLLRLDAIDVAKKDVLLGKLKAIDPQVREQSFETIGPTLGKELLVKTGFGIILAISLIIVYLAVRFPSWKYGVSAAIAAAHDIVIVLGVFSLLGHFLKVEVDILFVTAILTILFYLSPYTIP